MEDQSSRHSPDDIYGQDPTVKPANPSERTKVPQSEWSIPSPDYTVIPEKIESQSASKSGNQQETIDVESLKAKPTHGETTDASLSEPQALQADEDRQVDALLEQIDKPSETSISVSRCMSCHGR